MLTRDGRGYVGERGGEGVGGDRRREGGKRRPRAEVEGWRGRPTAPFRERLAFFFIKKDLV